jgi:hypothetical protein
MTTPVAACVVQRRMVAFSPIINLFNPTHLGFQVSWVLVTLANLLVYVVMLVVFVLGATVRLPGARKQIAAVERQRLESEKTDS